MQLDERTVAIVIGAGNGLGQQKQIEALSAGLQRVSAQIAMSNSRLQVIASDR